MLKNYLKTSIRNLRKRSFYSINNILGLALGFSAALYIFQYTAFERAFDSHIPALDQKVRLTIDKYRDGELITSSAETYVGCGPVLHEQLPEVESYTRTFNMAIRMNSVISYEPQGQQPIDLKLKDYYYADSSFLSFFGYELLQGDTKTALSQPHTAVITQSLARIYFGDENPIGKVLHYQDEDLMDDRHTITGVLKDPPANTHLPFSLLLSYSTFDTREYPGNYTDSWKARKAYTYLKLKPQTDLAQVESKLVAVLESQKEMREGNKETLKLQPLATVHYASGLGDEPVPTIDGNMIRFLEIVAILILLIACINFINLSTTALVSRASEVGVRKVLGAGKRQLVIQYYSECALINLLALGVSLLLLWTFWLYLNDLAGTYMPVELMLQTHFWFLVSIIFVTNLFASGLIPSILVISFDPIRAIGGKTKPKSNKLFRQALIIGQFTISFCLIMATVIVSTQLNYMQQQKLGFEMDKILVVRVPGVLPQADRSTTISDKYDRFKSLSLKNANVTQASSSLTIPGHERAFRTGTHLQSSSENPSTLRFNGCGPAFITTYNMEIIAGRNFKEGIAYDIDSTIILSKSAVEALGIKSPEEAIGRIVKVPAFRIIAEIIGVVNDYRLASVKNEIEPTAFLYFLPAYTNFFSFKLQSNNASEPLQHIESVWNETFPGNPIDYFFLEDFFNKQYAQEEKLTHLFATFGILALVLAAMGLLGLSAYTAQQRTKEIGVRKALGCSVWQIFNLLSIRFVYMVTIASVIGVPIIYHFAEQWLSQFPLQADIPLWFYTLPLVVLLLVTFISIGYQTLKAARHNPVDSLRYE